MLIVCTDICAASMEQQHAQFLSGATGVSDEREIINLW